MKKRVLNKRGKVAVSILIAIVAILVYHFMIKLGANADSNLLLLVIGWFYLLLGQFVILNLIWD